MPERRQLLNLRAVLAAVQRGDAALLGAEVFHLRGVVAQLVGTIEGLADRHADARWAAEKARALASERPNVRTEARADD